jgi:hypothetical protein
MLEDSYQCPLLDFRQFGAIASLRAPGRLPGIGWADVVDGSLLEQRCWRAGRKEPETLGQESVIG